MVSLANIGVATTDREWTVFGVEGFHDAQRARLVAVPTPGGGARPAFETLLLDNRGGALTGYKYMIDAETGAVLVRENLVHQLSQEVPSQQTTPFTGSYDVQATPTGRTGTCGTHDFVVPAGQRTLAASAHAVVATNDIYSTSFRRAARPRIRTRPRAPRQSPTRPRARHARTYTVKVCPFLGNLPETDIPAHADGAPTPRVHFTYSSQSTSPPSSYPPKWMSSPSNPLLPG